MRAIILAGGKGSRLKPYTELIPKPLVPIGGKTSIIEIIIKQLSKYGFNHITLAVNHLSHLIESYLGSGKKYGIKIDYILENKVLGTVGPLTNIKDLPENFLVMNGDILTNINYKSLLNLHKRKKNLITLATFKRNTFIDFGTLETKKNKVIKFVEKPTLNFNVSMGVYCLNKKALKNLKKNKFMNFDVFIKNNIKKKIYAYNHKGFWLDIGRVDDYEYANKNFSTLKKIL